MQLRRHSSEFEDAGIEIVVVGPDDSDAFTKHFESYDLPFVGLPDPEFRILDLYGQRIKLMRGGRMPAQVVVDPAGVVQSAHYGSGMSDILEPADVLKLIAALPGSS